MIIEFRDLTHHFDQGRVVLDHLSFRKEISTLAIIGTSGGGKSTLLRILGGLIRPTSGQIVIDGQVLNLGDDKAMLRYRQQIGFVFQQGGMFNHLTAVDNIALPLEKVHGFGKKEAREKALSLLTQFGLEKEANKTPAMMSGGQKQRVAIAKAIAPNPRFLLLDEPTSALDPEYTVDVLNLINMLKQEGMHFVIVTHEMGFARQACEQTAFLYEGKIWEFGESQQLFSAPQTPQLQNFLNKLLVWN